MTVKQATTVIAVGGSIMLSMLGFIGVQLYEANILVHQINVKQEAMSKTVDRILDRIEATEKQIDWTDHD